MSMIKPTSILIILISFFSCSSPAEKLPILSYTINNQGNKDYYTIEYVNFVNQLDQEFNGNHGKVYIANFFFTRCPSICPPIRYQLKKLANDIPSNNFLIVSHTIDPEFDSPTVLKAYAESTGVPHEKWQFLYAPESNVKAQAQLYKTNFKPNQSGTDFYHSSYAALVDQKKRIRGFYNLLIPEEINLLKQDVQNLLD